LNIKKTTTYDVGNPGLDLDRHKNVAELNWFLDANPPPLDIWISNCNAFFVHVQIYIYLWNLTSDYPNFNIHCMQLEKIKKRRTKRSYK